MECRAGTIYERDSLDWMARLYGFFLVWLCCSGYGTVEMVGGAVHFFFFLFFSLVVVRFLGCWIFSVGYLCYILRFSSVNLWFFRAVSCFESY